MVTNSKTHEIGDLLFSVLNLSRFLNIDGEKALTAANAKFSRRYQTMVEMAVRDGKDLSELELEDMERYWQRAKKSG